MIAFVSQIPIRSKKISPEVICVPYKQKALKTIHREAKELNAPSLDLYLCVKSTCEGTLGRVLQLTPQTWNPSYNPQQRRQKE